MAPSREWKSNSSPEQLTSSLRPRKGIIVYNERQLQTAAREKRRRATLASTSSMLNASHHINGDSASTSSAVNSPCDGAKSVRKRSSEDLKKKNCKISKVELKAENESLSTDGSSQRRSSRISAMALADSSENSSPTSAAEDDLPSSQSAKSNGIRPTMTVGEALMTQSVKFSELARGSSDSFDRTMASVLSNITSKSHSGYLKMSHKLASEIATNNNSIANSLIAAANRKSAATKPYVYKPRVPKLANENGLLTIIKNTAADPTNASLLMTYKPRTLSTNSQNGGEVPRPPMSAVAPVSEVLHASAAGGSYASALAAVQPPTLLAALANELAGGVPSPTAAELPLSQLFGSGAMTTTSQSSPMPCLGTGSGRRVAPNFTSTNTILRTSFPAELEFSDYYRPPTQLPPSHVMARTTVDVRPLGKALFYDDPAWSRYTFPQRSLFAAETLVYFYNSQRWPDRKLVLVPFGESVTPGDFSYTCGSCFKFKACLRHRFDLAPRDKIPVIMARYGQLLDDPDSPSIPHICDPAQLSDKERAALAEYGELMAETRESKSREASEPYNGVISAELERHNMLIVVSRLTECCSQLMSVGFDFTGATLRDKAYDIADEINLPRHCISDVWLQNVGKWLGITGGDSTTASVAIFGEGTVNASTAGGVVVVNEPPNVAPFTNANDYLERMVSVAMSLQADAEDGGNRPSTSVSPDDNAIELTNGAAPVEGDQQLGNDAAIAESQSCEGVSVLVSESRPLELIFNSENGMLLLEQSTQLELDKEIKVEADMPAETEVLRPNDVLPPAAVTGTLGEVFGALPRHRSGSSASGGAPTTSTSRSSSLNGVVSRRKKSNTNELKETITTTTTASCVPPVADKKTLYAVIQESFTKTNYPEVANALAVIKRHVLQRDHSLLPMFNNFSARISKMMYTTKARDGELASGDTQLPTDLNGTAAVPVAPVPADEDIKSFFHAATTNVAGC